MIMERGKGKMPRNNNSFAISCIEGDGIGLELFRAARLVLDSISEVSDLRFEYVNAPVGDKEFRRSGKALPESSLQAIRRSDVCLKAPVGESAKDSILKIRQELDLYANIRPARNFPFAESKFSEVDLVIVRENTEDLYVGRESTYDHGNKARALKTVSRKASTRIARYAFDIALARMEDQRAKDKPPSVVCVSKSNVLPKTDGLFVKSCESVSKNYPSVSFSNMYVDSAAMNLVRNPAAFDVIVTSNMYGDILSDEASQVAGGIGIAPSANIGDDFALFEPVHGAAPDIAGKGIANPVAMLLSAKMMLDWLGKTKQNQNCVRASSTLLDAICAAGESGVKTPDIGGSATTEEVAKRVSQNIKTNFGRKISSGVLVHYDGFGAKNDSATENVDGRELRVVSK
jgi:3-isopropylmalate dehydrogenase